MSSQSSFKGAVGKIIRLDSAYRSHGHIVFSKDGHNDLSQPICFSRTQPPPSINAVELTILIFFIIIIYHWYWVINCEKCTILM